MEFNFDKAMFSFQLLVLEIKKIRKKENKRKIDRERKRSKERDEWKKIKR